VQFHKKILINLEEILVGSGLVLIIALVIFGIINRYVIQMSAVWVPELTGFFFAWVVFLGASAAWKRSMHVKIEVFTSLLPTKLQTAVRLLADVILLAFLAYIAYLSCVISISAYARKSPVLGFSYTYVYIAPLLSFILMFGRALIQLSRIIPKTKREQ
jgi:TRAP-type C4-dicarboxylate transport system permease small subunit